MRSLAACGCLLAAAQADTAFLTVPGTSGVAASRPQQQGASLQQPKQSLLGSPAASIPVQEANEGPAPLRWLGAGLLAGLLAAVLSSPAQAAGVFEIPVEKFSVKNAKHLQLCKDNKKFHKRIKNEIYKVGQRQKKYPEGSLVFNRFEKKIAGIERREEAYGNRYCGIRDGLPRTIVTGENVRGGIVIPGLMFLYTAGWIGWAGRSYLIRTQDEMKELNIDVPLALTCMASGFSWPVAVWQEIVNGELVVPQSEIRRSFW